MNKRIKKKKNNVPKQNAKFERLRYWVIRSGLARAFNVEYLTVDRCRFEVSIRPDGFWSTIFCNRSPRRVCFEALEFMTANL